MDFSFFKKRISALKDLSFILTGDIAARAISSIFWLSLVSLMTVKDYGLLNYYVGIASLGQLISMIGTTSALTVYVSKNIQIQSTFFLLSLIAGSISSLTIFYFLQRADVALLVILLMIGELVGGVLLGKKQYSAYARINLFQKILLVFLGITFFKLIGVDGIILGMIGSYCLFIPAFYKQMKESKIDFSLLKSRKSFIISNYTVMLASGLRRDVDKLIIPPLLGFVILGNYSLGIQIYTVLMMFSMSFFKYTLPHDAMGNQNKRLKKLMISATAIITVLGIILTPIVIPAMLPQFSESIQAIQIMIISIVPATISLLYISRFLGQENSKFVLAITLTQLATLVTGFILLGQYYGIDGLAISFVLSSLFSCSLAFYLSRRIGETRDVH